MANDVPVFFSANMSLGISLLAELARKAAAVLGGEFDIEILEKHHNQKIDAPSGTALLLADSLKEALPYEAEYVYDRHAVRQKRDAKEHQRHGLYKPSACPDVKNANHYNTKQGNYHTDTTYAVNDVSFLLIFGHFTTAFSE
jgi:dihydrodipicolinate reductase